MRIAREGWPIIGAMSAAAAVCAGVALLAAWWLGAVIGALGVLLTAWAVWFFRDPERTAPTAPPGQDILISPADGRVIKIDEAPLPRELLGEGVSPAPRRRIAIFLNLFDVHVNRVPCAGRITRVAYVPGRFLNASLDKASEHNERSAALMVDDAGREIGFVQIAGLVAWRIVNHLREGQRVALGERFGLIRFGSRAEVYLPADALSDVRVGQRVVAGETILGHAPAARGAPAPPAAQPLPAEARA